MTPTHPTFDVLTALRSPRQLTREFFAGIVTTLALVPEVISFSVIAGVDPMTSLVASIVLCLTMTFLGGRPGVITAAAGSVALVVAPLVREHGVEYLLPTVVLAGLMQIAFGLLGLSRLMRYVPRSVMLGFVNALGILIFVAQLPHVLGGSLPVWGLFALTLAIVLVLPRFIRVVPSALVAIVVVTAVVLLGRVEVPDVAGEGSVGGGLPGLTPLTVPLDLTTLQLILPTAISVALVGLMESLLTAKLVDEITETPSHKGRESWALGVANVLSGVYGGVGGCAMIGQTVLNVKTSGARTRISTFVAGVFMLVLVTGMSSLMGEIPMVALAAVMMVVAVTTVDWHSVRPSTLRRMPVPETLVMAVTIGTVVVSSNLAYGVIAGVVLAMILFARRVAHVISADRVLARDGLSVRYVVHGPLFFGSSNDLVERFHYADDPVVVIVDLRDAQIWDASTVAALDSIAARYERRGATLTIEGLDDRSERFHGRLSGYLGA